MTGSILVSLKAIAMNTRSLGATFGALVWVFQDGHLSDLLGFQAFGAIEVWCPIAVFVFAFSLSMDYEVFLLSRIKESYDETGDSDHAVATGPQRSGRIITSAADRLTDADASTATSRPIPVGIPAISPVSRQPPLHRRLLLTAIVPSTTTSEGVPMLSSTPRIFIGSTTFTVTGMTCAHCERAVTEEIAAVDGVESVTVDLATGMVTVTACRPVDRAEIAAAVDEAGYALVP